MLEQLIELLPSILAGLFPSLMAVIPTIVVAVKNIKVNKQVDDLLLIVDNLKAGNLTIGQALDQTLNQVNGVKDQIITDFKDIHDKASESITKDVEVIQEKIQSQIKSFEMQMAEIQLALMQNIERMKNYDNVPTLPEEGQEEIPVIEE